MSQPRTVPVPRRPRRAPRTRVNGVLPFIPKLDDRIKAGRLASHAGTWHGVGMTDPRSTSGPVAGGAILALTILAGVVIGLIVRQPTLGLLGGLLVGTGVSLWIWQRDRRG